MDLESYASEASNQIKEDVLLKARNSCYQARDMFYACLEKQANKKPTQSGTVGLLYPIECQKLRDRFVNHCRPTWVKHFDRQYCYLTLIHCRSTWVKHFDRQYCSKKKTQRHLDDCESRRGPLKLPQPCAFKSP